MDKRDGAEEAHRAHNPRVGGSKPSLATIFVPKPMNYCTYNAFCYDCIK